jgi:hypothetical protein
VEELITEVPIPFSNWDWQTFSKGGICGCFNRLWIAILESDSNLAVKDFAQTLRVKPVESQMGLKVILTELAD